MEEKKPRGLDGFFLRVKRGDRYVNRCFSDLTEEEQKKWLARLSEEGLRNMCMELGKIIRNIGDQFDIVSSLAEDE
jgi:hypothetical protein